MCNGLLLRPIMPMQAIDGLLLSILIATTECSSRASLLVPKSSRSANVEFNRVGRRAGEILQLPKEEKRARKNGEQHRQPISELQIIDDFSSAATALIPFSYAQTLHSLLTFAFESSQRVTAMLSTTRQATALALRGKHWAPLHERRAPPKSNLLTTAYSQADNSPPTFQSRQCGIHIIF